MYQEEIDKVDIPKITKKRLSKGETHERSDLVYWKFWVISKTKKEVLFIKNNTPISNFKILAKKEAW